MEEKVRFNSASGASICAVWDKERKECGVVLCHGFGSDKDSSTNKELIRRLSGKVDTLRIDFYGHGESGGRFEDITASRGVEDVLAGLRFLKKKRYKKVGLVGSSFGGLCSLLAAIKEEVDFVALKAPASDIAESMKIMLGREGIKDWKKKGYIKYYLKGKGPKKLKYSFYEDAVALDVYKEVKKIRAPVLIVHGDKDDVVPIEQSKKLIKKIRDAKLIVIEGADHNFSEDNHFNEMETFIYSFIIENCV